MALSLEKRTEYMRRANLTDEQLKETTGKFAINPANAQASESSEAVMAEAAASANLVAEECTVMSAYYNQLATETDRDARQVAEQSRVEEDRAVLESLFADEYRFTDPRGNVGDKAKTIDVILSGKVRRAGFGKAGFLTTKNEVQVHSNGESVVSIGQFTMRGTGLARNVKTGEIAQRSRSGTYRTTHTYVFRDKRWQLAASQMTRERPEPAGDLDWEFIDD